MSKPLRILHIEDSAADAALITRHLTRASYDVISDRVDTAEEMRSALQKKVWDVILCDYSMPNFGALSALSLLKEMGSDLPVIIISGTVGEEVAVEAMRAGAHDYMMKDNLIRLAPTIERELRESENRRARRRAEDDHFNSERKYRLLFDGNPLPMWVFDRETLRFVAVNEAAIDHYGFSRKEFTAMTIEEIRPPEELSKFDDTRSHPVWGLKRTGIWKHRKKDGTVIDVEITSHPVDFGGRDAQLVLANDITERKKSEEGLRQAEEKYRSIFENAVEGIFQSSPDGRFISVNPAMAHIFGYDSPEQLMADRIDLNTQHYVNEQRRVELENMLVEQDVVAGFECEAYRRDRSRIWTTENIRTVRDEKGLLLNYEGSIEDITERKSLEIQLQQSQKLEAIGILAGGIAHDFNNLLTVITGYSTLAQRRLLPDEPLHGNLDEVLKAADRAAGLTRQLLAFSRKQVLQPRVLDLNAVVSEVDKMLGRLIGEDIELHTILGSELGSVKADPGQIEQVLMNLAVNARDAMPQGGKLTIETENVFLDEEYIGKHISSKSGPHVMLAITDSGTGMDEETCKHIFEPFFSTKERGKGTGLGLSTVYGIVKQSGGNIWVYSEVGRGTTFKVYLPRVDEGAPEYRRRQNVQEARPGTETILLAEDDERVRHLARDVLETYGYNVLEAANGGMALLICERSEEVIHLLLTDVVMPEMSGPELAIRLNRVRPGMKVLYMSGYTDNAIVHQGALDENANFIQKPFQPNTLALKVRDVLDLDD